MTIRRTALAAGLAFLVSGAGRCGEGDAPKALPLADQAPNTWVKQSPLPGGAPSPRLGYESSWDYDPALKKMIRWGGHDPGGGGPQLTETWTYDVLSAKWEYLQTNNNPPGNCCCRENAQCGLDNKFYRFSYPSFGHGWYWDRSRYLREDSVWTYDLGKNKWTNLRPGKEPALNVGKPAFWDRTNQVFWVYDTKLRVYDPYTNTWHTANPSKEIGKRTYAAMELDPTANKIVLFGDHYQSDPKTWVYDIAADAWTDAKPKESPPGIRTCPTFAYDSKSRKFILLTLADKWDTEDAAKRTMETWTYDLAKNEWKKMNPPQEPEYSGTRSRMMRYLPDLNVVILESRTEKEQQVWTYRLAPTPPPPAPPPGIGNLSVVTEDGGKATLSWISSTNNQKVYRGEGETPWKISLKALAAQVTNVKAGEYQCVDTGLKAGTVYYYYVTAVNAAGEELVRTVRVRTQPKLILDSRVDVLAKDKVVYSWKPSDEKDVVGYVVERAVLKPISGAQKVSYAAQYADKLPLEAMVERAALGPFERLTPKPIAETSFTDSVDLSVKVEPKENYWAPYFGKDGLAGNKAYDMTKPGCPYTIYAYRVRAVNRLGVEGGASPYQMTVANEVENLFSKEGAAGSAELKWDPSPHKDLKGYLVYRLNGRGDQWDKDSGVVLLTPEPIKEPAFTDKDGGAKSRQYYVVVADALGQQGLASHGAWTRRPYGKHYEPWLPKDGWHQ